MLSRLSKQLSAFVVPKPSHKLPPIGITIGRRRLHDNEDGSGDYAFLGRFQHGQGRNGVQRGPDVLRTFLPPTVRTFNPISPLPHRIEQVPVSGNNNTVIHDPKAVGEANLILYKSMLEETSQYLDKNGRLPSILLLGGDHSLGLGSIGAVSTLCAQAVSKGVKGLPFSNPELVVVWVDAHDDVLTPFSTRSGNLHGCPVSPLLGWGEKAWKELKHFDWAFDRKYLPPGQASFVQARRLAYIGFRGDVRHPDILSFSMNEVTRVGMEEVIKRCLQAVDPEGTRPIHLSFDIDAMDPRVAPSTGTPVPNLLNRSCTPSYGLFPPQGTQIVEGLKATGRLVAMDLVEVNPDIGDAHDVNCTLATSKELIDAWYKGVDRSGERGALGPSSCQV